MLGQRLVEALQRRDPLASGATLRSGNPFRYQIARSAAFLSSSSMVLRFPGLTG